MADEQPPDKFTDLLKKIARVPKQEIDEREQKYQDARKTKNRQPAKSRQIVPRTRDV